jgi:hypothetical protein
MKKITVSTIIDCVECERKGVQSSGPLNSDWCRGCINNFIAGKKYNSSGKPFSPDGYIVLPPANIDGVWYESFTDAGKKI